MFPDSAGSGLLFRWGTAGLLLRINVAKSGEEKRSPRALHAQVGKGGSALGVPGVGKLPSLSSEGQPRSWRRLGCWRRRGGDFFAFFQPRPTMRPRLFYSEMGRRERQRTVANSVPDRFFFSLVATLTTLRPAEAMREE